MGFNCLRSSFSVTTPVIMTRQQLKQDGLAFFYKQIISLNMHIPLSFSGEHFSNYFNASSLSEKIDTWQIVSS